MSEYPEHEKLAAIADRSQAIGEFLEWLRNAKGIYLAELDRFHELSVVSQQDLALLAEHFDIDQRKIEDEKQEMLAQLRAMAPESGK